MLRPLTVFAPVWITVASLFATACGSQSPPADLGRWRVEATLTQNTCGPQSGSFPQRFAFQVTLGTRQGAFSWTPDQAASALGTWDPQVGSFRIAQEITQVVAAPDRRIEFVGCTMRRADVIEGLLPVAADSGVFDAGARDALSNVDASADAGDAAAGDASVDAGPVDAPTFRASESIVYGAAEGSDCRAQIGAGQGQVLTLPCVVTYTLVGVRYDTASSGP